MAEPRRRRAATEAKAARVLDATEEIILSRGYAAVTSRNVAAQIGIQPPLVHYYFPTIDDLFIAVLLRGSERNVEHLTAALTSAQPLRAWWKIASDPRGTALFVELLAAASHRPALREEVGRIAREVRRMQMATLGPILAEYGIDPQEFPPALIAAAMQGLAFSVVTDEAAGYETSTAEVRTAMGKLLTRLERRRSGTSS